MAFRALLALAVGAPALLFGQAEYRVYNDHPRLFLEPDRLQRLTRDAERQTARWRLVREQLDSGAAMPERSVALALAYRITGDREAGREALELVREGDPSGLHPLRQTALVFDWCSDLLEPELRSELAQRLLENSRTAPAGVEGTRDAALALVAAAGHAEGTEAALGKVLQESWEAKLLPALRSGELVDRGASLTALLELSHVLRYNLDRDLWTEAPKAFRALPMARMLGYLPHTLTSEEGKLRVNAVPPAQNENAAWEAALGRIAEMLLVAYESSSRSAQFLQGWLRNDTYTLRGPYGALYEFLWINPYLPGLAPASAPGWTFDPVRGRIFARRDDRWIGYVDGKLLVDDGGGVQAAGQDLREEPIDVSGAAILWAEGGGKWKVEIPPGSDPLGPVVLFIGLEPGRVYEARAGKDDWRELRAERGGVAALRNDFEAGQSALKYGVSVRVQLR